MTCLFIVNEAPGLGEGAWCAVARQPEPANGQNIEWMLQRFLAGHRQADVCRTCMEALAITEDQLIPGAHQSNLEELSRWTRESERLLVF